MSGATLDDADFKYSYYIERMLVTIGMNWFKPAQAGDVSPVIHFRIEKDGTISDAAVERSSGLPFVDRAALRALAFKWIRIAFRCWKDRVPYDDFRYLQSLRQRGSPLAAR